MKFIWLAVIMLSAVLAKPEASGGFGYQLIIRALECIQSDVRSLKDDSRSVATKVDHLKESLSALAEQFKDHKTELDQLRHVIVDESRCPQNGNNGTYHLELPHNSRFEVYCENGWIVIHRRFNGSLDFNRKWGPYREGFGNLQGEHWMGLEKMHQITLVGSYELKVVLESFEGVEKTAKYKGFKISNELEQYQLNLEKFVEGDAGNIFMYHDKMKFSSVDRDNDQSTAGSCALSHKSGWWFKNCHHTNLNGLYKRGEIGYVMSWLKFYRKKVCLKSARMMIRRE